MFQWGNKTGARENIAGQGTVQRLCPGWGLYCDHSPHQDRDPIIPRTRKACFSSRERTRLPAQNWCQQVILPSFILSHLHSGVPRKARLSLCTWRTLQEKVTDLSWNKGWPCTSGKQRPRKSKGHAQVTQQGGQNWA